jgi:nucleotide-binding universal stress UspA family protein
MLSTVLLPTDLSPAQDLVVRFAAGLPELGVRRVVCCHVVDATGLEGPVIDAKVDAAREQLALSAEPLLAAGLEVDLRVLTGDPERELLAIRSTERIDAAVCGASGKTAADRLLIGSVSERLVRDSGVPCLTVRYDMLRNVGDPADVLRRFGRMLLVPTDFSPPAARALDVALALPPSAIGTIRVVNVVPKGDPDIEAEALLRDLVGKAKAQGIRVTPVIGHGAPERAILREVQGSGITGIVVGSRGRSVLQEALLGSVSMTLMRQAPCPVMMVP